MKTETVLANTLSPVNDGDNDRWQGYLKEFSNDIVFTPDSGGYLADLIFFREDELHISPIPNLFINTNLYPVGRIKTLLNDGTITMDNDIITLEDVIDLKSTKEAKINLKHYDRNGQIIIAAINGDTESIERAKSGIVAHELFKPPGPEDIAERFNEYYISTIKLLKLKIQFSFDLEPNQVREVDRYLIYFPEDKVSFFKNYIIEERLKVSHLCILNERIPFSLLSARFYELFLSFIGTKFLLLGQERIVELNLQLIQNDEDLFEAYKNPENTRYLLCPRDVTCLYDDAEDEYVPFYQLFEILKTPI